MVDAELVLLVGVDRDVGDEVEPGLEVLLVGVFALEDLEGGLRGYLLE